MSLKQAREEAKSIKEEIATLKQRTEFQYQESIRTLNAAYQQQIAATSPKIPLKLSEKDPFESTSEYLARRDAFNADVNRAESESTIQINKLKGEEQLKLAEAKQEYLEQQIKVLSPFIERLKALQMRKFVLPSELVGVELGEPDADRSCFPTIISHNKERWTVDWIYYDRDKARDIYKTRTFLKAEAVVQLSDKTPEEYVMTEARITHPGTGEQQSLVVADLQDLKEISEFDYIAKKELLKANKDRMLSEYLLTKNECIVRSNYSKSGQYVVCGEVIFDTSTGLEWIRNANLTGKISWAEVTEWISTLEFAGVQGWRVPTCQEFRALLNGSNKLKYLESIGFINVQDKVIKKPELYLDKYWALDENRPKVVYEESSGCHSPFNKSKVGFIIPVRAGQ